MISLSNRIIQLSESETLAMAQKSRELKAQGIDVINLSLGEPDFFTPEPIKEAAKQAIDQNFSFYTPVNGYLELREAICKKLKRENQLDYTPDHVVVTTGAKQALINVLLCMINPGDEVVIAAPYWVSYRDMVQIAEGTAVIVKAGIESDFKITPHQLEQAITPKTRMFMFTSPSNPTGSLYTREELEAFAKVFEKNPHVYILSDEIYEFINFEGKHQSIAQFGSVRDRVIIVNGVSKGYAMTGWRLGYLVAHKDIAKACTKLQGQFTSGANSITQRAAITAMEMDATFVTPMLEKFRERRDLMLNLLKEIPGLITNSPEGAFYLFPDASYYFGKKYGETVIANAPDLCMYLINTAHVAIVPGDAFGAPECIRISYATSNELLIKAVSRIKVALANLS